MLKITEILLEDIFLQVRHGYPNEVCGVLVGERKGTEKKVHEAYLVPNVSKERKHDRYECDPVRLNEIDHEAKKQQFEIVGVYHSHPDHPAVPSQTDLEQAWPVWSYLILTCQQGNEVDAQSWQLNESKNKFEEEELKIIGYEEMGEA